jgi:hypothetical protein
MTFGTGGWATNAPATFSGNVFLTGLSVPLPNGLPKGLNPVGWSATFTTNTPGISLQWQWAAAAYTTFSTNHADLGVKPLDDNQLTIYKNSDHAGTPEAFKSYVTGGARGGGGSNFTGSLSSTASVNPPCTTTTTTSTTTTMPATTTTTMASQGQTIAGHIYDCSGGSPTTAEVLGGYLSASGPSTVPVVSNPLTPLAVNAGDYVMSASAPPGYQFVTCGGNATVYGPTSAAEPVTVPVGGTGVGIFYVASTSTTTTVPGTTTTTSPPPPPCTASSVNMRWHYSANGTSGSWSGTKTASCPGAVTMGPQAMEGDLKLTPGTAIQVGYDFTMPGNNASRLLTVNNPAVTFTVHCVTGAAPSSSTFSVPMTSQSYSFSGSGWFPSGDQKSALVYQGSLSTPNLCAGGQLRLDAGGTFTASLG